MTPSAGTWDVLTDSFGRRHDYLRVSLTDRCDFRCLYCMPEEGVAWKQKDEILSFEEIERLVGIFARLGCRKVRLTGGEPTVRRGYLDLVARLASTGLSVHLTTNGARLKEDAKTLAEHLAGINVSIDSLRRERFEKITRRDKLDDVLAGIEACLTNDLPIKVNVVVMPGMNDDELLDFVEFVRERPMQVRFIEFMPFLGNLWKADRVVSFADMKEQIAVRYQLIPLPTEASAVAKEFAIEGFRGTIGFVTSMTDSFCGGCNRLRLTADGSLKTCLFLPPRASLRDMMRAGASDEELATVIRADLMTKWAGHPPMNRWKQHDHLTMVQIGG